VPTTSTRTSDLTNSFVQHASFSHSGGHQADLHSFPTRRSSDLNAKREMRLRLGKVTVADVLAAQPVTTNLLKFMRASITFPSLRSEERFSRNAETDLVCRLLLEKKKK